MLGLELVWISVAVAVLASLGFASYILKMDEGTGKAREIASAIRSGAKAYLLRQYKTIIPIAMALVLAVGLVWGYWAAMNLSLGALLSGLAGYLGMSVTTRANVRTAYAATKDPARAFNISFLGGMIMGLFVIGFSLLGMALIGVWQPKVEYLTSFALGSALIALLMRVGGGIYTKAADVGADLVGKVEKRIPEDDPRNPAVIADLVGDNVGDCAGMGSDLFESAVCTLLAPMVVGIAMKDDALVVLPLSMRAIALISSVTASFLISILALKTRLGLGKAINVGMLFNSGLVVALTYLLLTYMNQRIELLYATASGIIAILVYALTTQYYTRPGGAEVRRMADAARGGPAMNIIIGTASGMESVLLPAVVTGLSMLFSYEVVEGLYPLYGGLYGITMAAIGFESLATLVVGIDAYGPIADNASGIAEMSGLEEAEETLDRLDSLGNTTKAICKGFAIGAATFAAVALFAAYLAGIKIGVILPPIELMDARVLIGMLIGAATTLVFSGLVTKAVGSSAHQVVEEVRRQFKEIPGILEGEAKPDYTKCVDIVTRSALKGLIMPAVLSILPPILVGFVPPLGPVAVAGLIVGNIITCLCMGLFMAHTGTALDNAKKMVEDGYLGGKGTYAHASTVIGDTFGDPLKDATGPSLNILSDVRATVAVLFGPLFLLMA